MTTLPQPPVDADVAALPAVPAARLLLVDGAPLELPELAPVPADAEPLDFDASVRRITPRLQRYAARRLGDPHEAEEVVQEALLRAYKHADSLATEDDLAAWTTVVTGRLVIDRLRVRGRSTTVAEVPEGTRTARDTADVVVGRAEARLALDALDAMPARQAAVLWAREVEGLAYDAIGERFGMTEPAVRSILTRARKALRKEYAERGGTLPAAGLAVLAPWIDGLTWVDRLRQVASRSVGGTAVAIAGAGMLGVALLPSLSPAPAAPTSAPVVRTVVSAAVSSPSALRPRSVPAAAAPATARRAAAPVRATAVRPVATPRTVAKPGLLARTGLTRTCASTSLAGAGGTSCAPAETRTSDRLVLDTPLPVPVDRRYLGLTSDELDCDALPDTPLTTCTTLQGETR